MSEKLKNKAIELGIKNVEALTASQLKLAVENAEKEQAAKNAADTNTEGPVVKTDEELKGVALQEQALALATENTSKVIGVLSEFLGIADLDSLTPEQLTEVLAQMATKDALEVEAVPEPVGKSAKAFNSSNGRSYVFDKNAPASFRYLGLIKTQEDWHADKDAMELMVAGNLSFLILKK